MKQPDVDGDNSYGSAVGLMRRVNLGGAWVYGSVCGSRLIRCDFFSSRVSYDMTTRGCKESILSWGDT